MEENPQIPEGIHTYGMREFRDSLFVGLGTRMGGAVARSGDGGQSWQSFSTRIGRVFELFALRGELYCHGYRGRDQLLNYTHDAFVPISVDPFAGVAHSRRTMLVRSVPFRESLLYIGADNVNDHQWTPFAAYHATQIDEPHHIALPPGFLPYDIVVREDVAYLLANRPVAVDGGYEVAVFEATDPASWTEVLRVEMPTFARSFELQGDRFYFGLGTRVSPLSEASGDFYEVAPP